MRAPGSGTLADQLKAVQRRALEQSRSKDVRPVAQVYLGSDATYGSSGNYFATGTWQIRRDDIDMVHLGSPGEQSYVEVVIAGWYLIHYHAAIDANSGASSAIKITRTVDVSDALASAVNTRPSSGADGTVLDAYRPCVYLQEGDRLYWASWSSGAYTLRASSFTIPTEITVMYLQS